MQLDAELGHPHVPERQHLGEVVPGVDVHHGEGDAGRPERLLRQPEHHDRVLAAGEQQHRTLHLRGHLADDVDGLGLQGVQLGQPVLQRPVAGDAVTGRRGAHRADTALPPGTPERAPVQARIGRCQLRPAHDHVGKSRVRLVVLQGAAVDPARVQPGGPGDSDRSRRVPLELTAGVHVGVGVPAPDARTLHPGRAHGHELGAEVVGQRHCEVRRAGAADGQARRPAAPRGDDGGVVGGVGEALGRERDRPGDQVTRRPQGHMDGPVDARPQRVLAGAVERVHDPDALGRQPRPRVRRLLAQHRVTRAVLRQPPQQKVVGVAVTGPPERLCDQSRLPKVEQEAARLVGESASQHRVGGRGRHRDLSQGPTAQTDWRADFQRQPTTVPDPGATGCLSGRRRRGRSARQVPLTVAWARSKPDHTTSTTVSAASTSRSGSSLRSTGEKSRSTKSAASCRPGGRPMPRRRRQ